jgi:hypothetical protein
LNSWTWLTDDERAALGSVVVESANLEATVDLVLLHLTNLTHTAYEVLMGGRMLGAKLDALRVIGLAKLRSKKRKKAFTAIMDNLAHLNSQRTIAVHGIWGPDEGGGVALNQLLGFALGKRPGQATASHRKGVLKAAKLGSLSKKLNEGNSALFAYWRTVWLGATIARSRRRTVSKSNS